MKRETRSVSRKAAPVDYVPLEWSADSLLSPEEREHVDRERRSLWNHGVQREPQLTRMAFEFGAVAAMVCGIKPKKREPKVKHETQSVPEASAPVNSEPLPCPFCGEAGTSLTVDSDIESVVCDGCKATGPSLLTARDFDTEEEMYASVVAAWNVRASFWIPVSVCLPEKGALVLAKLALGTPLLALFYGTDWERESDGDTVSGVSHWAPLPGALVSGIKTGTETRR